MATIEALAEDEVTTSNLAQVFKRAFIKTEIDEDGDLVILSEGPRIELTVNHEARQLRFAAGYRIDEFADLSLKHEFVNKMNDKMNLVRFSVPEARDDVLVADYYLLFYEGVSMFQIVSTLRLFARIVPEAIRSYDEHDLVK